MAIDFNKLRKKPVQEESTDIDSLIDSVFAEDNVQEPVAEVQKQPKVVQEQPKEAEQPREGGFWNTYLGDTIEKIGAGLQNFSANTYGLLDKGARKINDLVGDTRGAHTDATGKAQSGFFGEVGKAAKESVTDLRAKSDRYKGKNFVELWKDDKAAAVGDVFLQASESLPQSLMAAFTGPLGIASIGATVANEKYDQLDESNPNMGESQKMLNALLTGTAEAGSEYLGSVPVGKWLKGMYSKMGAKAAEEHLQKGLTGWIGTNAKKLGVLFPPVAEGVEEIASQVAENITDWATGARPDLNPMEGAFESFVYGAGGGAQFSAMSLPAYGAKLANKAKTGYEFRKATKEFSNLFEDESVDDVVAGLSSMTPEEQKQWLSAIRVSDYTDDQKIAASRLLTTTLERNAARSPEEYASMREEGERMLIDSEMKRFEDASRPYISDNGRYQQVKLGEEDVFITGGTVGYKQNEFGEYVLDLDTTSEELYYVDSEGNTQVTTGKAITKIVDIADYEQEYNEYLQHVTNAVKQRNQLQESISQEVTIENGDPVQYMGPDGNLIDGIAADTSLPEVITLEDGTVVPRENVIPNTQGAAINPPADLQTEQPTAQTGLQTEQQPVQPVQDGTQVVEQPAPVFPVDKNNNIDYSQISEPEMYAQALQSEFDNEAVDVIDEQIQSAQARLDKASKNTDAIARRRAMKVEQAEVERLKKVKEILTPVQQNVSETAAETAGNENLPEAGQSIMSEEELSMLTEPERRLYVAENSNDPLELADLYEQVKDETEYSEMLPWQAALLGRRVNKDSFVEHSDKNNITGAIAKSWFADNESGKKAGLDVIAAELSEYGIPVTENDIVEFILEHPGNSVKKRSKVSMTAERRFKQLIKDLTGENVGGLESNSGRLVLAGLRAGVRAEQEKQALPYDMFTIPDSIVNFFEETGLNPDDFNSFEELNDAVQRELESGTFVFPLGPTDLQTINNIVQHGIKQQANYTDFASRVEKAGTQRAAQQPIFETAAGTQLEPITIEPRTEAGTESTEAGTTEQVTGEEIEYTPEDMAEIDAAIETRPLIEVIQEAAVVNEINEAEKDVDVEPTEAQKEAGNYKKGHIKLNGFDITIENPKGSQRSGIDADGKKWSIVMANSYGYIKGTKGKDNDQVDVFLGDSPLSDKVFVVDQVNKDGSFDEHKCMIGFNTIEEAESAYLANYEKGWTGLGSITEMPVDEFREWVKEGKKVEPVANENPSNVGTQAAKTTSSSNGDVRLNTQHYSVEGVNHETPIVLISKTIKKDVDAFAKDLASKMGWDHETDKKGKPVYSSTNIAPAGGDVTFSVKQPGSNVEATVYITYEPSYEDYYDGYQAKHIRWTLSNGNRNTSIDGGADIDVTTSELADTLSKQAEQRFPQVKTALDVVREEAKKLEDKDKGGKSNADVMDDFYNGAVDEKSLDNLDNDAELTVNIVSVLNPGMSGATHKEDIERLKDSLKKASDKQLTDLLNEHKAEKEIVKLVEAEQKKRAAKVKESKPKTVGPNVLVTDERRAEIIAKLKAKRNNLNAGIDPEMFALGIELAVYHIERGARKFADYARAMINDLGDEYRPRLKQFYNGVKNDPDYGHLESSMDSDEFVRAFDVMGFNPVETTPVEGKRAFVDAVKAKLGKESMNIVSLRRMAAESGLTDVKDTTIQEYVELALIEKAKEIAYEDISTEERYQKIVDLYNNQPTISMRSSERIEKQQYSTPLPMAFLAGEYVKTIEINRALEPSSGNGMMVFNVPTEKVIANEIDEVRLDNLREQPFLDVMNQDATTQFNIEPVDAVIMNPPFGKSAARDYDGYKIAGLDEQMVVNALSNLKPDGKASIIIGGHTKYKENGTLASEKAFFGYLYNYYNVTDVINIGGSLYSKQGTSFPVRMILINGRRKDNSRVYAPLQKDARAEAVTTFEELYNRVNENIHEKDLLLQEPTDSNNDGTGVATGGTDGVPSGNGDTKTSGKSGKRGGKSGTPSSGPDLFSGHSDKGKRPDSDTNADGRNLPHSTGSEGGTDVYSRQGVDRRVREQDVLQFLNRTDELGGNDVKVDLDSEKTKYPAKSKSGEIGSVVPTNVAQPLANVLSRFKDIDSYVQTKLGYPSKEDLYNALAAEQIDSVAMAIYQIENGKALIIGDMTGVGKGRQAAAIIRYATLEGKKPIFITEKAHLFSDMYRDLLNIGSGALVPFMLNSKSQKSDPTITDKDGVVVYKPLSEAKKNPILKSGKLPDEYDYIMLTYSQLNTDKEKGSVKQSFISRMAEGNIIVMDESHNAGGDGNTGAFLRDVLPTTKGVAFLSGTFAKRPDNMPIYALKTSMNEANMSNDELIAAIAKGGVPLQEIMSKNLVESGQMVRRERDFAGVKIDWITIEESKDEHYKAFDAVIEMFNELIAFQSEYIAPIISGINDDLADTQGDADFTKGTKDLGVSNTPFASKTFNVVRQLLFSLKAKDVARYAIEELKAGKKPVIAVSNTMEGFMNELGAIDEVLTDYDFSITLKKGLDGQFRYTVTDAFGKKTQERIELSELPREGQEKYHELIERINKMSSGITISPIDVIRDTIEKAGYRVGELTGRTNQLEFNDDGTAVIKKRTDTDKKKLARDFNSGELDALILNQSASTGISLHASSEFKDQKPRVMISAQTQLDVNTEVQMRGRVDRTGQVHRGEYKYICSPIPAEQRLVMMFKAKLKSLDANTTSNQKSKANDIDIVDFLNKYGDEVCIEYLKENPEINEKMLDPEGISALSEDELAKFKTREGAASKVAGRAALLSVAEQEQFYKEVSEKYMNIINYLNDNNSNDLEITTLPLRAETKESVVVVKGVGTVGNPFAQDSIRETVEIDVLKKPMKSEEVKAEIERLTGGLSPKDYIRKLVDEVEIAQEEHINRETKKGDEAFKKKQDALREKKYKQGKKKGLEGEALESFVRDALIEQHLANAETEVLRLQNIENRYNSIKKIFKMFPTGRILMVPNSLNIGATTTYTEGVLMGYKIKPGQYSPSSITASFATLDSRRRVDIPLSKFDFLNAVYSETMQNIDFIKTDLNTWDSKIPTKTRRTGYIVTGNVLQAYGVIEGQLVSYSTVDGGIKQGILLPENYEPKGQKKRVMITESINDLLSGKELKDSSGDVKIEKEGSKGYAISVPLSKIKGGKYFLDAGLRSFVVGGDFKQMGNKMVGYIKESNIRDAVNYLSEKYSLTTDVTIDDVRFKDMADVNRAFNAELQMQIDDVLPKGHIYKLGMPSDVLLSAGIPNLPIEMNSDKLSDKSKQNNHPFDLSKVMNLPDAIHSPIAVFDSKTQPGSKVILTEITSGEKNFVVAIRAQKHKTSGRRTLLVNEIRSLYPKDTQQIAKWIESGELMRWVDKEKAINWLGKQQFNSADVAIPYDSSTAANIVNSFDNPTLDNGNILSEIELLSSSLNTPVRVVRDISEIKDSDKDLEKRMLRSRGWYDTRTGEVVIVLANNKSVADAQATVLHEAVGHMGLRKLLGRDFNQTMSSIYDSLPKDVQKSLMDKYGSKLVAAEEYAAEMAETLSDPGIVQRIASAFKHAMRKLGIKLKMTDGDIMTLLWKSKNRLTDGDSAADIVRKMGKEDKVKSEARVFDRVFRDGTLAEAIGQISDDPIIKERMHAAVKSRSFQLQEGYQDRMLAVKKMQQLLEEQKGTKLPDYMNVYMFENTLSSRNTYEIEQYNENYYKPMMKVINNIIKDGDTLRDIEDYAIAKHGIERNDLFRLNALKEEVENLAKNNAYLEWLPDDVRSDSKKFQDRVEGDKQMLLEEIGEGKFSDIEGLSIEPFESLRKKLGKKDYAGLTALEAEYDAPASDIVKSFESRNEKYIDGLWKSINNATKASLKKWFDSGMITKDTFNKINGMYSHYMPLRGFAEETASDVYEYFTEQESAFNSPLRKADGRKSKPETPFAHILSMAGSSIVGGNKNIMKLHLLRLAQAHPSDYMTADKTWYVDNGKVDPETGKPMYDPVFPEYSEDINTYRENVEQFEMEMNELSEQGIAFKGVKKLKPGYKISKIESSEHMVRAVLNGEEYHILVHGDPRVAQAVNGINDKGRQESAFMKKIAWANRQMAANFTTRNPAFIASNLVRDVIFASTALSIKEGSSYTMKFEKNIFGGAGGALKRFLQGKPDMSKQEDVYLKEFLENGGETGHTALYNIDKYKKMVEKDARQGKKADARKKYMSVIDFFANGARWAEDLSRFSVYMASRQSGRSVLRSVSDAKEVTVNFNRKGSGSYGAGYARAAYLFFNAAVQSLSNAAVLMKDNPVKGTAALMSYASVGVLIPAIIASLGDDDDLERYNNLPDYVRKNHLCIPVGDMFVKIPLPIELRAFYGLGDQMYRTLSGLDGMGESLANIALSFMDLLPLNPSGGGDVLGNILPDATVPFYESYYSNKDFTGKPIAKITPFNEFDPEYKRVYKSANAVPVYVSQFLNSVTGGDEVKRGVYDKALGRFANPASFEHLFGSYFGGLWTTLNHVYKSTENVVKAAVQEDFDAGENQVWRTAPILNRFVDEGTFNGSLGKINERYFKAVREMRETKHLIKGYEDKLGEQLTASEAAKIAAKISDIMNGNEAKRMYIIEDYSKEIQSLSKESENASRDRKVQVNDRINELKERMLEKLKEY